MTDLPSKAEFQLVSEVAQEIGLKLFQRITARCIEYKSSKDPDYAKEIMRVQLRADIAEFVALDKFARGADVMVRDYDEFKEATKDDSQA